MSESPPPAPSDSSRHAISVLIVTAAILWNLVAFTRAAALQSPGAFLSDAETCVWVAAGYAQVMLAAGYLAWGRWNVALRAALIVLVLFASSAVRAAFVGADIRLYLTIYSSIMLGIAVPLSCIRFLGLHVVHPEQSPLAQRRGQFTLRQILSLTAAVAILLTLSRWLVPDDILNRRTANWLAPVSAFGIVCLAAPLAFHRWWWSALTTAVAALALAYWMSEISGNRHIVEFVITQWILVSGCSGVIRLAGYRFTWQSQPTMNQSTSSAPPHTTAHPDT